MKKPVQSVQLVESKCLIKFIQLEEYDEAHPHKKLRIIDSMDSKCYFLIKTSSGYCCGRDENRTILGGPFKRDDPNDTNIKNDDFEYSLISSSDCPLSKQKKPKILPK